MAKMSKGTVIGNSKRQDDQIGDKTRNMKNDQGGLFDANPSGGSYVSYRLSSSILLLSTSVLAYLIN